jgi:hypothetical protein
MGNQREPRAGGDENGLNQRRGTDMPNLPIQSKG